MITIVAISVIIVYLILVGALVIGFDKVEDFKLQDLKSKTSFSVVIPFRNEVENLPHLLKTVSNLNYPSHLFEIIMVNDASEDDSVALIEKTLNTKPFKNSQINIKIISNHRTSSSPKKDAITSAINIAKHEWIITTDADCLVPKYWLDTFDEFIQTQDTNCIAAPVMYSGNTSFFNRFQTLDFLSLQGTTIGGFGIKEPFLCNGANFGYSKIIFNTVNGFEDNSDIASGDDIFLLEKIKKLDAKKVHYLKNTNAIVQTKPVDTFKELIEQRLRWASKTSQNKNWKVKCIGLIVIMTNTIALSLLPLLLVGYIQFRTAISILVIKLSIDFLLLFKTSRFFKQEHLLLSFITSSILYPIFSIYIVFLSLYRSYQWKARTHRK
ncbi:MAG: glycosyltransferase [Winogradskyella sp.]